MTIFGIMLRQTSRLRLLSAFAGHIRTVRNSRRAIIYENGSETSQFPVETVYRPQIDRSHPEKTDKNFIDSAPMSKKDYIPFKVRRPEESLPEDTPRQPKEYIDEEKQIFAQIPEIAQDDAYVNSTTSSDNAFCPEDGETREYEIEKLVNEVEVFQALKDLDVEIERWENKPRIIEKLLKLSWTDECRPRIQLLTNLMGMTPRDIAWILSKNPFILCEDIRALRERIEYLHRYDTESRSIDGDWTRRARAATRIVTKDCYWLLFPTKRLENRENFFQNYFQLTRPELNSLVLEYSRILTWSLRGIILMRTSLMEDMHFSFDQVKNILLYKPKIFCYSKFHVLSRYKILKEQMGLSCEDIATFPQVLTVRDYNLEARIGFLRSIHRAEFTKGQPGYISPKDISVASTQQFVKKVAKSTIGEFERFMESRKVAENSPRH